MRRWYHLPEGWLSLLLLLLMVTVAVSSLQAAAWEPALRAALAILLPAGLAGLVVGFLLAWFRRVPRFVAHLVGALSGVAWIVQLSGTLREVHTPPSGPTVSFLDPALQGWKDLAVELLIRAVILWRTFLRGTAGEDIVLFIILLALLSWLVGFLSAWFAFRSRWPALAVGLPGLVLLLNTFYAPRVPLGYFSVYVFLALVFLVYYFWRRREAAWQQRRVRYPPDMAQGVLWAGVLLSAILVLGTSLLPTTAGGTAEGTFWERFFQPWREVRQTWERLFSNVGVEAEPTGRLGEYGSAFGLGGARLSSPGIAFEVRSSRNDYLRGIAFDRYSGRGWSSTADLGPLWTYGDTPLPLAREGRVLVRQVITPRLQGGNMVFAYAEPISVTLPAVAELGAEIYGAGQYPDVITVRSRVALADGQPYVVHSLVAVLDKTTLRRAGRSYPSAIAGRYLQLPANLPSRVRELGDRIVAEKLEANLPLTLTGALTLTSSATGALAVVQVEGGRIVGVLSAGEPGRVGLVQAGLVTPYDAAEAIEEYLRTQYTYREDISAPPQGVDAVDYFLFDSRVGYCDYFASAMVVLLRTQGVPARLVRGYASGTYDANVGAYLVPADVAHSWPEVYFPLFGWQRFEPTAAGYTTRLVRPEVPAAPATRPPRTPGIPEEEENDLKPPRDLEDVDAPIGGGEVRVARHFPWAAVYIPGAFLAVAGGLALALAWRANHGLGRFSPPTATYERMCRWADIVRAAPQGPATPFEISDHLSAELPAGRAEVEQIAAAYVRERFSLRPLLADEFRAGRESWRKLRWLLWGLPLRRLGDRVRALWCRLRAWWRKVWPQEAKEVLP